MRPTAVDGWAFLVGRGRRAGYRTLLAPGFLVEQGVHDVLADSTGTGALAPHAHRATEIDNPRAGRFAIIYTSMRPTAAEVEEAGSGVGESEPVTDEHGRPLELVYGIVTRHPLDAALDPEDLREAREQALRSFRGFLADEEGHSVDTYAPFALRTEGRASVTGAPEAVVDPAATSVEARRRPRRRGVIAAAATVVGLSGVATVVALSGGGSPQFAVRPAWAGERPEGIVRLCSATPIASQRRSQRDFARRFPGSQVKLVATVSSADAARDLRLSACDVIALDVIHTARFADSDLLYDMSPYLTAGRRARFDARLMKLAEYEGRAWGVPKQLDAGVLYYRADRVRAPTSWRDLYGQARGAGTPGLRLPIGTSEGLTVVLLELAYGAGAAPIVSADGRRADIDQAQVLAALTFLREGVRDAVVPAVATTEQGAVDAFERGRASFLRSWPAAAARISRDAGRGEVQGVTAANTRVASLPPWKPGGRRVSMLGGHNLVIPRSARNPSAALRYIDFVTSEQQVRWDERDDAQFPVLKALENDPRLEHRSLAAAIRATTLVARPSIPRYAEVSRIISTGARSVLRRQGGAQSARDSLREIERDVQRVLNASRP